MNNASHLLIAAFDLVLVPFLRYVWPVLRQVFCWPLVLALIAFRWVAEMLLVLLNKQFLPGYEGSNLALKDISSICQQIDLRLQQCCFWPWQWMLFRRQGWRYVVSNRAHYIRYAQWIHMLYVISGSFYNSMWLVLNDMILGFAMGALLLENDEHVAKKINEWTEVE